MAVLCYGILWPINSLMGPIHNAGTGDCNDSIKPRSSISAPGWCIDWALVRVREGQVGGSAKCAITDTHTHVHNILPNLLQISAHVLLALATAAVS